MTHNSFLRGETPPEKSSLLCPECGRTLEFVGTPPPSTCKGGPARRHLTVRMV